MLDSQVSSLQWGQFFLIARYAVAVVSMNESMCLVVISVIETVFLEV